MSMKLQRPQKMPLSLLLFIFALLVGGCFPFIFPFSQSTTQAPDLSACTFIYAWRSVPDLTEQLQNAFLQAGASEIRVTRTEEYGEDCVDEETHEVVAFVAMGTTVDLEIAVASIEDRTVLSEYVTRIVTILNNLPPDIPSHARVGRLALHFVSPTDSLNMVCHYSGAFPTVEGSADEDLCPP